ncbi:MAG: hypothetical protein AB7G68_15695 [Nitrospiraceae bacterium]
MKRPNRFCDVRGDVGSKRSHAVRRFFGGSDRFTEDIVKQEACLSDSIEVAALSDLLHERRVAESLDRLDE